MDKGTVVVFGGCGFIGTNVSLEAAKRGYDVIAFDSLVRKGCEENIPVLEKAGVTIMRGDVRNPEDFWRLPKNIVGAVNFAANPGIPWAIDNPMFDFNSNARGALNILEHSRNNGKYPIILASTNKVYSDFLNTIPMKKKDTRYIWDQPREGWLEGISHEGVNEGFPIDGFGDYPHSPYGVSKIAADLYHQEYFHTYGVPTVINRMSCIYGYYQKGVADQGWADHFVRVIGFGDGKIDIFGDGYQVRDMLWGGEVAELYMDELQKIDEVKGKVFNVGGGKLFTVSLIEAIQMIEEISGKKATITHHDWRHADQKIFFNDLTKVKSTMEWYPKISPREGLQKIYDRYNK